MKKIFSLILFFILIYDNAHATLNGQGNLKLSDYVVDALINYLNPNAVQNSSMGHEQKGNPMHFAVSVSGMHQGYTYCPRGKNCRPNPGRVIQHCEKRAGEKCYIFSRGRKIVWNGINFKFKRKASALEIKSKLEEWGFMNISTSSTSNNTSKIKKKNKSSLNKDVVEKIKELNDLYKSGILTEEEFTKLKKRILE